jgi:uncharacterized protein YabN with tetrapyrrole methylase and pyrophosphatase domain
MSENLIEKLIELEVRAKQQGFYWQDVNAIIQQIYSECDEVKELLSDQHTSVVRLKEEIGDLMHAVVSLCLYCDFSPKKTLAQAVSKFEKRFNMIKVLAEKDGHQDFHGKTADQLTQYWQEAKKIVG